MKIRNKPVIQRMLLFSSLCLLIGIVMENDTILTFHQSRLHRKATEQWLREREWVLEDVESLGLQGVSEELEENSSIEDKKEAEQADYTGNIDCVLEIPAIDLINLVLVGGNQDDNLAKHYLVTAQEEIRYGKGSYIICGHHSFLFGVALNRLNEVELGDSIYIIKNGRRDVFVVDEIVDAQWGMDASDFNADVDKLAIYTCRAQRERPKPYLVVRATKKIQKEFDGKN